MRTKIIAGNLVAVLVVGLLSYYLVSSQLRASLVAEVDEQIEADQRLFERTWRLSGLEFLDGAAEQASEDGLRGVFSALDENGQRSRAHGRANAVAAFFAGQNRAAGPPEVVMITNADGLVIARNANVNANNGDDLKPQLRTLAGVLETGHPAIDVWSFSAGQRKLLQTAIAPIRDVDGDVLGALVVGYDMSNGMAAREGALLGRDLVFLTEGAVYSSSLTGSALPNLNEALFTQQQAATTAALAGQGASERWLAQIGDAQYVGVTGSLPRASSTPVAYAVLANRTAALEKSSPVMMILVMTAIGFLIVLVYGFLIGTSFLKPIEQMEEGILAAINGRTDIRLDIESAELGGLAYRINQLLNVVTGTPEEDSDGRVSSPPEDWGADAAASSPGIAIPPGVAAPAPPEDEDDPALAAQLAAEPEDAYYERIYQEYVAAKQGLGENVSNITKDRFVQRLQANEKSLLKKHGCRMVRFQVQTRGPQVNLRPVIIR
jgi:hypothetical protein